jgi:hypothetical protein
VCTDEYIYEGDSDSDESPTVCVFKYSDGVSETEYEFVDMSKDEYEGYQPDPPEFAKEISHYGPCGVCSSAQDLAAIMNPILSIKSFECTRMGSPYKTYDDFLRTLDCMLDLGFTQACAELWASNGFNNAKLGCNSVCLDRLAICLPPPEDDPCEDCPEDLCPVGKTCIGTDGCYSNPKTCCLIRPDLFDKDFINDDCSLDKCLDCDDKKSNEIFTQVAGRTSRNSGLVTANNNFYLLGYGENKWEGLRRPCDSIENIFHSFHGAFDFFTGGAC